MLDNIFFIEFYEPEKDVKVYSIGCLFHGLMNMKKS
jgi:hypothetical protein